MNTLEYAEEYLSQGFSVIPIHPKDKRPLVAWSEYQKRQPTLDEVDKWFNGTSNNIAIVTGNISNVDVIDCDSIEACSLIKEKGINSPLISQTGRGYQLFFTHKDGARNFQKRDDLKDIDFRGEGGYVVAPPSIHPTGKEYKWLRKSYDLNELPDWILGEHRQKTRVVEAEAGVAVGSRNNSLARLAGGWVKAYNYEDCLFTAREWNKRNKVPLDDSEIVTTITSIWNKEKQKTETDRPAEDEIISFSNLNSKIESMFVNGIKRGTTTGWGSLDVHYTVRTGEWTLVTGIPGHGKSEFLDNLMVNLARDEEWPFGIISAENMPHERHASGLIEKFVGKPFQRNRSNRMTEDEYKMACVFLDKYFFFINPPEDDYSIDRILLIAKKLIEEKKIKGLIIDPWNEVNSRSDKDKTETESISLTLTKIRRFARYNDIHIWVVAHPTKLQKLKDGTYPVPTPYDVSGSAHWRNKSDNALCVWRDMTANDFLTTIHIQKIRFKEIGRVGAINLNYDLASGTYKEAYDSQRIKTWHDNRE